MVEFIASWPWLLLELAGALKALAPPKEVFIPVLLLCPEPLKGPCHESCREVPRALLVFALLGFALFSF